MTGNVDSLLSIGACECRRVLYRYTLDNDLLIMCEFTLSFYFVYGTGSTADV